MPVGLGERIALCPDETRRTAAIGEIEQAVILLLTAISDSAGHQWKARELEHALQAIAALLA